MIPTGAIVLGVGVVWASVVVKALRSQVSVATLAILLLVASLIMGQFLELMGVDEAGTWAVGLAGVLLLLFWDRAKPYP